MAERLKKENIKVTGHLEEVRGIFHMKLNWIDETGKRVRKAVSTGLVIKGNKKRAEEMLHQTRKEQERLLRGKPSADELFFADFMQQWLDTVKPELKPTTYGSYAMNIDRIIIPYFRKKGTLLRELTADDINEFYAEQLKRVKAMTIHKYHNNINKALKYAVENGIIEHSCMDKVKRPKVDRFVGKFLKQSEAVELFEAVKGHKLELGVLFGAFYGLRRAEVIGLRWESINFEANTITIEHTVTVTNIDGKQVIVADDTTKTKASVRTLPLIPGIREKLLAVKEEQDNNRRLCGKYWNKAEGQYIYTDAVGNRINPGYLTSALPQFLEDNGFRRMRFHDLRHSCASLLLANGVPLKQIQEWLGHSDFAITANTYAHLEYNSKVASANAMTWIQNTSLAGTLENTEGEKPETTGKNKGQSKH